MYSLQQRQVVVPISGFMLHLILLKCVTLCSLATDFPIDFTHSRFEVIDK